MGLNSFRKYRPKTFDEILGQNDIISILKNQIKNKTYTNAYLFCGERGTGKTTTARVFAKAINCEDIKEYNPCNSCNKCIKTSSSTFEIDAASNNSVEDIRNIIENIRYSPIFSMYNVYIIDEVHMLSQSAFNAFLKTLEEPPKYIIFILITTELDKIPSTIISRCQVYNFKLIDIENIVQGLKMVLNDKSIIYDDESLYLIAEKADGGLRDALSILDSIICYSEKKITSDTVKKILNILDDNIFIDLFILMQNGRKDLVLLKYNEIKQSGFSDYSFINNLLSFTLNLYLSKNKNTQKLINKTHEQIAKLESVSNNINEKSLDNIIKLINKASIEYKSSINKKLYINILLIEIIDVINVY